jgi:hypothetical protein
MLKITRFCRVCKTKTVLTFDGSSPKKADTYYFTCEKGHHCEVFASKLLMDALKKEEGA